MNTHSRIKDIINEKEVHLVLYTGVDSDNRDFHAFVVIRGTEKEKLAKVDDPVVLGEYGKVLYSNYGKEPEDFIIEAVTAGFKETYLK